MPLIGILFVLSACSALYKTDKPPVDCNSDVNCYAAHALERISAISSEINYWSNLHTYAVIATIIFGSISTVMIDLQGDNNKIWTRPIGLVSTTLGAAIVTLLTTFHVQENIDKLVEIRSKVAILTNALEHDVRGKPPEQIEEQLWNYSSEFNKLMNEQTKLKGSAGRLATGPTIPLLPPPTKDSSPSKD